jgi:hypothetical protein
MEWKFWDKSPRPLPGSVIDALVSQFSLTSPALDKLSLLQKAGHFAGRAVRDIRVYDPALLGDGGATTKRFEDLQEPSRRKAVLFEGHIEKEGTVVLLDRRPRPAQASARASA